MDKINCKRSQMLSSGIVQEFRLPEEASGNIPYIRLLGRKSVTIENHRGVLEFSDKRIRLYTKPGILCIEGKGLYIESIERGWMVCKGEIDGIRYEI